MVLMPRGMLSSSLWQVPQVWPLPLKVSLKNRSRPRLMSLESRYGKKLRGVISIAEAVRISEAVVLKIESRASGFVVGSGIFLEP
jgi:hypothetical protein